VNASVSACVQHSPCLTFVMHKDDDATLCGSLQVCGTSLYTCVRKVCACERECLCSIQPCWTSVKHKDDNATLCGSVYVPNTCLCALRVLCGRAKVCLLAEQKCFLDTEILRA